MVGSLSSLSDALDTFIAALTALLSAARCDVLVAEFDGVLGSTLRAFDELRNVAYAMLACAVLLGAWIWPSILLQIRYGGVGREPGCPNGLRCCCCWTASPPRGAARAIKVDKMSTETKESTSV